MPDHAPLPDALLREERERTVAALAEHFAHDHLTMEELERRLDVAQRSRSREELAALLRDLPAPAAGTGLAPQAARRLPADAERDPNSTILAIMSGVERRGGWRPAARNFVIAVMGGIELDFRDVPLPPGETEVFVFALMGGVEIIVTPDISVDSSGIAIMGGFAHPHPPVNYDPTGPRLKLTGIAFMGGVDVYVRLRGETAKDARRRIKDERRAQRRLRGDR